MVSIGDTGHVIKHNQLHRHDELYIWASDHPNLQTAIDAAPDYSVILLEGTTYDFDTLTIDKSLTLRGVGSFTPFSSRVGSTDWNNPQTKGTVLKSNAGAADAITVTASNVQFILENLMVLGTGLETGVRVGSPSISTGRLHWRNVQLCNLPVGAHLENVYESTFTGVNARGCGRGFYLKSANGDTFVGCSMSGCDAGYEFDSVQCSAIYGGAIQGTFDTGILGTFLMECVIQGIYFENPLANYAIDIQNNTPGGDRNWIGGCHFGTIADKMRIASNHNVVFMGKSSAEITVTGSNNYVWGDITSGSVLLQGQGNVLRRNTNYGEAFDTDGTQGFLFKSGAPLWRSPDGSYWKPLVSDSGVLTMQKVNNVNI